VLLSVFIAIAVPVAFLYGVHWLDLYGTDRPRLVVRCFAWGLLAFGLSFLVNHFFVDVLHMTKPVVGTRIAPLVEEVFKSLVLVDLARRARLTYVVDGAIYGFASGIGFAAIENVRYIQLFPDNPLALVVVRDFSCALAHGTSTALVGIALGGLAISARADRRVPSLVPGMAAALVLHYAWNNFAFFSPVDRFTTQWILVGVGLAGAALVAGTILWGLSRERAQLHESLGMKIGISGEEASVVEHMDDLDRLLAPIAQRFGKAKCRQVANVLHLEAQLGIAETQQEHAADPALRSALIRQVRDIESEVDRRRRDVGVYVMLYVRSIFPATAWSLWARLAQTLSNAAPARTDMWSAVRAKIGATASHGDGLHARVQSAIDARSQQANAHIFRSLAGRLVHRAQGDR